VRIESLSKEPYVNVICYPSAKKRCAKYRIKELEKAGVTSIVFQGKTSIGSLGILGKGCVGIVVKALFRGKQVALKIRRTDANRSSMIREGKLHTVANSVGVGPRLYKVTRNLVLMDFLDGMDVFQWIETNPKKDEIQRITKDVLDQCFKLQKVGLDHGELSNLKKHIIISNNKSSIIDFESASLNRRVSNVTKAAQYLFIGGPVAGYIKTTLSIKNTDGIIKSLRAFKQNKNEANYKKILTSLNLIN
jgi:putative serine/threonine protein kinase